MPNFRQTTVEFLRPFSMISQDPNFLKVEFLGYICLQKATKWTITKASQSSANSSSAPGSTTFKLPNFDGIPITSNLYL